MRRVLLTGASGFIGRHTLDELLARDFEVHAISRSAGQPGRQGSDDIIWHTTDLLDESAVRKLLSGIGATDLMHFAWVMEHGVYWESPKNSHWLSASVNLLEAFSRYGGKRALIAGTCAEYEHQHGNCVEDTTPLHARSLYVENKLAVRDAARSLAEITALEVVWARVFFSFGPYERPQRLVPSVIQSLLAGKRARCRDGDLIRDFMYVKDVAAAMVAVLDNEFCGDINIASGKAMTLESMVRKIAGRLNAEDRLDFAKPKRRSDDPLRIAADITRLRDGIGWSPRYDLDAAIDETIAWWRNQAA